MCSLVTIHCQRYLATYHCGNGLATSLAPFHAAVFFLVNATYIALTWELIHRTPGGKIPPYERRIMRVRSLTTLCLFGAGAIMALKYPLVGLGICTCCLVVYLRPEPPWAEEQPDGTE